MYMYGIAVTAVLLSESKGLQEVRIYAVVVLVGRGGELPFSGLCFAPDTSLERPQGNMVTNSSAAVG